MTKKFILALILFLIPYFTYASPPVKTSMGPEPIITGEETWEIDGEKYLIESTILVQVKPYPNHLYAIKLLISEMPGKHHKKIARKVAKYALNKGYYEKAKQLYFKGKPISLVSKIGVAVIKKQGWILVSKGTGYRFQFNLSELK